MKITDEMIYENISQGRNLWYEATINKLPDEEHHFSLAFRLKMRKLISDVEKEDTVKRTSQFKTAVAIILLMFAVIFGASMSVEAYREKILEIIKSIFYDRTEYNIHLTNINAEIFTTEINNIPEGYVLKNRTSNTNNLYVYYEKDEKNYFVIRVHNFNNDSNYMITLDTEDAISKNLYINGNQIECYIKENHCSAIWEDENIVISVSGEIAENEFIYIIEGIIVR